MTSVLAQKGQIVIPKAIRDELGLEAGDDFEVWVEGEEIVLRPLGRKANRGLAQLLRNAPGPLDIPARLREDPPAPLELK